MRRSDLAKEFLGTPVYNSGPYYGGVQHVPGPVSTIGYSYGWGGVPHYAQPRHPSIVTTPSFNGYNPWGGIDTRNTQVDNTYFAPGRDASRYNGSARYVNRPVYDNYGRVVGQERGTEWYNPSTGQVHRNKQVYIRQTVLAGPTRRQCCTQRLAATSLR